ncbi:hypothetical protein JW992_07295 [candidate division KSB1 bacterium]|nr:hypothetical protein [candidate division KSB1 bacterium]
MKRHANVALLLFLPTLIFAQFKSQSRPTDLPTVLRNTVNAGKTAVGLIGLDPSRLHISHSYSMNYFTAGGHGMTQGLYLNTLTYEFDSPLTVSVQWGLAHQPFGNSSSEPVLQNSPFLSQARLLYQPSENTFFEFRFQRVPYNFSKRYSPFYSLE